MSGNKRNGDIMRLLEVTISKTQKVNLGNYESTDVMIAVKAAVESDDDLFKAMDDIALKIDKQLAFEVKKAQEKRKQ